MSLSKQTGFESQSCSFKNDFTTYKAFKWIVGVQFVDCFPRADSLDHVLEDLEILRLDSTLTVCVETETLETVPCDKNLSKLDDFDMSH